jgi:hypothetical protein
MHIRAWLLIVVIFVLQTLFHFQPSLNVLPFGIKIYL